jgi:hypothetical protein
MKDGIICPLLSLSEMAVKQMGTNNQLILCQSESCAWWDGECCSLTHITSLLYAMWKQREG